MNVLFVCTLNKARSIAAERLYRRTAGLSVRSAGISPRATHRLDEQDLHWADWIIVFESVHERWIRDTFTGDLPRISQAGVPDDFTAHDPELLALMRESLTELLGPPTACVASVPRRKRQPPRD